MSQKPTFKDNLVDWQTLVDSLTPHLTDMPALVPDHDALAAFVTQARTLETQQDLHKSGLRDVNKQRMTIAVQAGALRTRLATGLKLTLGSDSEKLLEFRVKPRSKATPNRLSPAEKAEKLAAMAAQAKAKADAEAAIAAAKLQKARAALP